MRKHVLTDLVHFLLKSQHELSRLNLLASSDLSSPFRVYDFTARSGESGTLVQAILDSNGQFTVRASQAGRTYEAKLPYKGETLADLKATIKLSDTNSTFDAELTGEDFLNGANVPADFQDLHNLIVRHVQRNLGWLSKGGNVQQAESGATSDTESVTNTAAETAEQEPKYRVRCSSGPDLVFRGKRIGLVRSMEHNGRHWRYSVFETKGGNWIGIKEGVSRWFGELPKVDTIVVKTREELKPFFGDSPLARELYEQIGLDYVTEIE